LATAESGRSLGDGKTLEALPNGLAGVVHGKYQRFFTFLGIKDPYIEDF